MLVKGHVWKVLHDKLHLFDRSQSVNNKKINNAITTPLPSRGSRSPSPLSSEKLHTMTEMKRSGQSAFGTA